MTPAERARQIDREEFTAECAAVRQRAFALLEMEAHRPAHVEHWIKRREPNGSIKPKYLRNAADNASRTHAANAKLYTAFNQTRTLRGWAEETGISAHTIRNRLTMGWTVEDAVTRAVQKHIRQEATQ